MPENYFQDSEYESMGQENSPGMEKESDSKTFVIPKEICPGMESGDSINLKIVRAGEDSYEVVYEPEGKGEPDNSKMPSEEEGQSYYE